MIYIDEKETARFGKTMARVSSFAVKNWGEVDEFCNKHSVEMITLRTDVSDMDSVHFLERNGAQLMDTLVYYKKDLSDFIVENSMDDRISIQKAETHDQIEIERISKDAFYDYMGHYHADPKIDNDKAAAGYAEWAGSFVANPTRENAIFKAVEGSKIQGFFAIRKNNDQEGEGVLYAVCPTARKKGVYRKLFERSLVEIKNWGCDQMIISTQINNFVVQKVWASSFGLYHYKSQYTFHLWRN